MKIFLKLILKKILKFLYREIYNHFLFILLVRKPLNTWVLSNFVHKKTYKKDAEFWKDETNHKTIWFSKISRDIEKNFVNYILKNTKTNQSILDVCCNQGRFLKELHKNGYEQLFGFDIMKPAIDLLKESPEYSEGNIHAECTLAQDYLLSCKSNSFDYAITFSASIELIHPSFKIFEEIYRITNKGFIFAIAENRHYYPRFYRYLIKNAGFKKVSIFQLNKNITLLHFEKFI